MRTDSALIFSLIENRRLPEEHIVETHIKRRLTRSITDDFPMDFLIKKMILIF